MNLTFDKFATKQIERTVHEGYMDKETADVFKSWLEPVEVSILQCKRLGFTSVTRGRSPQNRAVEIVYRPDDGSERLTLIALQNQRVTACPVIWAQEK